MPGLCTIQVEKSLGANILKSQGYQKKESFVFLPWATLFFLDTETHVVQYTQATVELPQFNSKAKDELFWSSDSTSQDMRLAASPLCVFLLTEFWASFILMSIPPPELHSPALGHSQFLKMCKRACKCMCVCVTAGMHV